MESNRARRSDRIDLELRVLIIGADETGRDFTEETNTLVITRHGAKIVLSRKLVPTQELLIRCHGSGKEADARVIGRLGEGPDGQYYGVEIVDPSVDLWGIEFPPASQSDRAAARVFLECNRCQNRELTYLDELEAEVFEVNHCLSRHCKRCNDVSLWKLAEAEPRSRELRQATRPAPPRLLVAPQRTQNERKHLRLGLEMKACIRTALYGEDVVVTEDVSREGFSFKSNRHYGLGNAIEVSVPYAHGVVNIFTPARIVRAQELPEEHLVAYGVSYVPFNTKWPRG